VFIDYSKNYSFEFVLQHEIGQSKKMRIFTKDLLVVYQVLSENSHALKLSIYFVFDGIALA